MVDEAQVEQLALELSRLRQRGLVGVDRENRRQRPVHTPTIDQLAQTAGFDVEKRRGQQLQVYLQKCLMSYGELYEAESTFIRPLYFDEAGAAPGPSRPSGLLRAARQRHQMTEDAFRKLQRQHLLEFARYLLQAEDLLPPTNPPLTVMVLIVGVTVLLTILLVITVL